jgi:hypothetical protein
MADDIHIRYSELLKAVRRLVFAKKTSHDFLENTPAYRELEKLATREKPIITNGR